MIIKLIVFIHGTLIPYPSLAALKDAITRQHIHSDETSFMLKYFRSLRQNSIQKYQPIDGPGLHPIDVSGNKYAINEAIAEAYRTVYKQTKPVDCTTLHFYTFGWNGYLTRTARITAAQKLHDQLIETLRIVQNNNPTATLSVSLVAHSHGGNVALSLAQVQPEKHHPLSIDEVIMLGTPIQQETLSCMENDMFKKIYHFFSERDLIQVADIFSTKGLSRRRVPYYLEDRITQVSLDINGYKPGHASLWMFGHENNPLYFERHLAIYPWPLVIFVPLMLSSLKKTGKYHLSLQTDNNTRVHCSVKEDSIRTKASVSSILLTHLHRFLPS